MHEDGDVKAWRNIQRAGTLSILGIPTRNLSENRQQLSIYFLKKTVNCCDDMTI